MAKKPFKPKSFEEKQKEIRDLTESLNERVDSYFNTPEQMKEYLEYKSKFYQYSTRNMALIDSQFYGANAVGNFGFWKKHGFSVNKGEKGIKILKPNPFIYFKRADSEQKIPVSKATVKEKQMIQNKDLKVYKDMYFEITYVFDISQTNATAKDLPDIFPNRWLEGKVENYSLVYQSLEKVAEKNGIKIVEPYEELGAAKGVSYTMLKQVALNPRNSELQNVKTLIHELAHATIHTEETNDQYTHNEREFQAELTAFTVSSYLGLDTSEYSLQYISHYSKDDTQFNDKIRLLDEVVQTAHGFIEVIEKDLVENRNLEKESLEKVENNEPKVNIEWSEVEGLKPDMVMNFKEMNEFLLTANKELRKGNKDVFEIDTKYKVIDPDGSVYSPSKFTMSKLEDNQPFSSIAQQLYIQEPELYKKLNENYNFSNEELGFEKEDNPMKSLEAKFTDYQKLLQDEKSGHFNEETIVQRLTLENDYYDIKSEFIKAGVVTEKNVQKLEEKVTAAFPKQKQENEKSQSKNVVQELDR
ncbi:ImmA/IrrE family metallo-endopeptidase [Peribacillus frigoritolerans]|uniref:ImmA/IrrE family metallo-endopeptidase n=1 Tax=Peribacillus frigoritolerans TaxID=450367 RepID=UPI0039A2D510